MPKGFSTYLDALRFLAAMTVVAAHFTFPAFTGGIVSYQGALAGMAVTAFFVLSGYVIAFVSEAKETTLQEFAISQVARIYSVAIPALALTLAVDLGCGQQCSAVPLPMYEYHGLWKYLPVFLTFTNEIGGLHVVTFSNGVFWSLSYEVWYYITFGIAYYLRGWLRAVLLPIVLMALGIPALVYLPIWLCGVLIYHLHKRTYVRRGAALFWVAVSALAVVAVRASGIDDRMDQAVNVALWGWPFGYLHNSMHFSTHYLIGFLVAINIYAVRYCDLRFLERPWVRRPIVYAASFTFALYLAHRPFMNLWAFLIGLNPHSKFQVASLFALVVTSVWIFGYISEHRKDEWRVLVREIFMRLGIDRRYALSAPDTSLIETHEGGNPS